MVHSATRAARRWAWEAVVMEDIKAQLEKLRTSVAECQLIRDLATDVAKRELFDRLARHYEVLAGEVERALTGGTD